MAISKKITAEARKLARRFSAEPAEVKSMLACRLLDQLNNNPYDPSRGISEDAYTGIVLANAAHRVARELLREARMRARTVSLDAMIEESEAHDAE